MHCHGCCSPIDDLSASIPATQIGSLTFSIHKNIWKYLESPKYCKFNWETHREGAAFARLCGVIFFPLNSRHVTVPVELCMHFQRRPRQRRGELSEQHRSNDVTGGVRSGRALRRGTCCWRAELTSGMPQARHTYTIHHQPGAKLSALCLRHHSARLDKWQPVAE